jgi:arginine decarboxylase
MEEDLPSQSPCSPHARTADSQAALPLADATSDFLADQMISFTTPGHKRDSALGNGILAFDAPLINGADDARLTRDLLGRSERLAAKLWGASYCRFSVSGSTHGNQALAMGVTTPGAEVVASRLLHKSLFAGFVLAGVRPTWVTPRVDLETGLPLAIDAQQLRSVLERTPAAEAVFVVEPSYVGVMSDVRALARVAHLAGASLVADQAWGAHLGFHPLTPENVMRQGADAMVTSLHKTLAAFTQGAAMFADESRVDLARLDAAFELLNTTSPSAAILSTIDRSRWLMATQGEALIDKTVCLVGEARSRLGRIDGVHVVDDTLVSRFEEVANVDPTKLVISLAGTGANGFKIEEDLEAAGIRVEMADQETIVPLVTIGDNAERVERLIEALETSIERRRGPARRVLASNSWNLEPEQALDPREAFFSARERVNASAAVGRIAAETAAPYPPGIPAIAPGEVITRELMEGLRAEVAAGSRIAYCSDPTLESVVVVKR